MNYSYATATELAEVDFMEPANYLFMRTSQCMNRDSADSSNICDAGNVDEDIATSDEIASIEEQKVWVQRCLEDLFPVQSGGLAL
ncbi:hypothetical protein V1527DRAFT_455342 [Lipomyces starkeyi]